MLPRFDWWFVLEDLDLARDVLRSAIGTSLLGEQAKSMFDFRSSGDEYIRAWEPELLLKVGAGRESLEVQRPLRRAPRGIGRVGGEGLQGTPASGVGARPDPRRPRPAPDP